MYVPPPFPEPETVDRNVAADDYDTRLRFIRKVVHGHAVSVLIVGLCAALLPLATTAEMAGTMVVGALVVLSAVRRLAHGTRLELVFGLAIFPALALGLARLVQIYAVGQAIGWGIAAATLMALLYVYACRRDFSFLGQFTLSGAAASVLLLAGFALGHASRDQLLIAVAGCWGYLFYYTYDLASLLQRRRRHEVVEAVVDLYRDLLNFVTYGFRVWRHWKTIRI